MPTNAEYLKRRKTQLEHEIRSLRDHLNQEKLKTEAKMECLENEWNLITEQIESRKGITKKKKNKKTEETK